MSLSRPQKAVVLALGDLEREHGGLVVKWREDVVLDRASAYPGGASVTPRTLSSLSRRCLVFVTPDARPLEADKLELTEAGRARLREGL